VRPIQYFGRQMLRGETDRFFLVLWLAMIIPVKIVWLLFLKKKELIENYYHFYTNDRTRTLNVDPIGKKYNETNHGAFSTSSLSSI
jgi:hypothetical protein